MLEARFGRQKTPREVLREHKRSLDRAIRELDRERMGMQRQEKMLVVEMKKLAKAGQMGSVKVMARDLVRCRQNVTKFYALRSSLQSVKMRIDTMRSQEAMTHALQGVTQALRGMNQRVNMPGMQRLMMEFERQNEYSEQVQEMAGETLDDAMAMSDEEEETEEVVAQVLDEIGIDMSGQLANANVPFGGGVQAVKGGSGEIPARRTAVAEGDLAGAGGGQPDPVDAELQARLDNLKRL